MHFINQPETCASGSSGGTICESFSKTNTLIITVHVVAMVIRPVGLACCVAVEGREGEKLRIESLDCQL